MVLVILSFSAHGSRYTTSVQKGKDSERRYKSKSVYRVYGHQSHSVLLKKNT